VTGKETGTFLISGPRHLLGKSKIRHELVTIEKWAGTDEEELEE